MNIVVFKEFLLHASERFVLDQASQIKKHMVTLVGLNKLKFIDLSCIKHTCLDQYSKLQVLTYKTFGFSPKLISIIQGIKPDLVHIHMGGDGARFTTIRKKITAPVVVTFHGTDATTTDKWKKKSKHLYHSQFPQRRKKLITSAQHFIAVSEFVKKSMMRQGFPEEKITVHYIGLDRDFYSPTQISDKIIRKPTVLFVGRLVERKGCHFLIQAMSQVQMKIPDAQLIVIGYGPERENLESLAKEMNVNISFLGVLDRTQIRKQLIASSIFCGPSITLESGEAEGFGMVFLEAQAMGTPVVSFDSGGIPEAVLQGKTGFLYPEKDVNGLSEGILTLLTNNEKWREMSEAGIRFVHDNYDIKVQTGKLESIYDKIIKQWREI